MASSLLDNPQHFIVDVVVPEKKGQKKVLVLLDGDQGISIEDCSQLSRKLSKALDEGVLLDDPYTLEISSPGIDHPLKEIRQYKKNVGRTVRVKLRGGGNEEGKLVDVGEEILFIEKTLVKKEKQTVQINLSDIDSLFVLLSFK